MKKVLLILGFSLLGLSSAHAGCESSLSSVQPSWGSNDLRYVCSARGTIAIDSNYNYTSCVVSTASRNGPGSGEFVINACTSGGGGGGGYGGCTSKLSRVQPTWRLRDLEYVCSARGTIAIDSDYNYTSCVVSTASRNGPGSGELVINACTSGGGGGGGYGGCTSKLSRVQPTWRLRDLEYVCSARGTIAIDSDYNYTSCVVSTASRNGPGSGEYVINSCRH
jgi:hypothetical protein